MIDIHTHILPKVDDGSDNEELSRKLLLAAINEGISTVCLTPHFIKDEGIGFYKENIEKQFVEFVEHNHDLNIQLCLGQELFIDQQLEELLDEGKLCTINGGSYILIEFPFENYLDVYDDYLYNLSLKYKIIIAHPERYQYVLKDYSFVNRWLENGYYLQANQNSFFNKDKRHFLFKLIEEGKLSLIASDAHNENRSITLKDAYRLIERKFNSNIADYLFSDNPQRILENRKIKRLDKVKKRFF